jgi:outer membrane protein, heavy metal efflux system
MNNSIKKRSILSISFCLIFQLIFPQISVSQAETKIIRIDISYKKYIELLLTSNLDYLAEKYNLDIAVARTEMAKIFPDPVLSFDRSAAFQNKVHGDNSFSGEISESIELGYKRKARIGVAESERDIAGALLDNYLRNFLTDASMDYLEAMKQDYLAGVMLNSYQMMKELSDADSIRLKLGSIKAIDAAQSKIEAGIIYNSFIQTDAERMNSFIKLSTRISKYAGDTLFVPGSRFENKIRLFSPDSLLAEALSKRADLKAAEISIDYYKRFLKLAESERKTSVDLRIGADESYTGNNMFSPSAYNLYTGISIPLKFSNLYKGDLKIARYQIAQGEFQRSQVEIKVKNEVIEAYNRYYSLCRQVENFNNGLLLKSKEVLSGKMYSYSRGETSLLEVLNAQRTYNDLQTSYIETMFDCFSALVELGRVTGTSKLDL